MENNKNGFTLVELLVAMAIIGILIALGIAGFSVARRAARDTARKNFASNEFLIAVQDFETRHGSRPDDVSFNLNSGEFTLSIGAKSQTYTMPKLSGISKADRTATCMNACGTKGSSSSELTIIYSGDDENSLLGVCLENSSEPEMFEGTCSSAI